MKPKIIFMPHANIQYSQLRPERREWVIDNCYKKLFDIVEQRKFKIAFEASGRTIEEIAVRRPMVMEQLKNLIHEGYIEPVTSPYIHFMVSNLPPELCVDSLKHALDVWEKYTGVRPKTGWNPECSWNSDLTDIYKKAGLDTLVMDADSFYLSFSDIREATGLYYDVQGHSNKNQLFKVEKYIQDKPEYLKYLVNPSVAPNGLNMIFRSDCMANLLLWYLMGATEGIRKEKVKKEEIEQMYGSWQERVNKYGSFIMPYAEDAEYIGSSAYFYVKQFNQARFFEPEPDSVDRFCEIVELALQVGYELATPSEVVSEGVVIDNPCVEQIENGVAWHGGTAKAWLNTDFALVLDSVCNQIYNGIENLMKTQRIAWGEQDGDLDIAVKALESAWVSDSRWPPAPTSPGRFNVKESIEDLYKTNHAIRKYMEENKLEDKKSLYSPDIMESQIRFAEKKLMEFKYFEE